MRTCAKVAAGVGTVYFAPRGSSGTRLDRLRTSFVGQYRKVKDPEPAGTAERVPPRQRPAVVAECVWVSMSRTRALRFTGNS